MVGCSIQNICAIITQIESSICKLVEQKIIYVTWILCIISGYIHILFEEAVSKSNFILTLLYLRIYMFMHYFTLAFKYILVYLQHNFHCLTDETDN